MSKAQHLSKRAKAPVLRSIADYDRLAHPRSKSIADPKAVGERAADLILRDVAKHLAAGR